MNIQTCLHLYRVAYDDMCMLSEHLENGQTLKLNEEYLSALLKFEKLHRTLSELMGGEIHELMARVQNHIKMFKKAERGIFSMDRVGEA